MVSVCVLFCFFRVFRSVARQSLTTAVTRLIASPTGQVQKMNKEQRHLFCRIIIALDNDDREEVIRLMKEAGFKSKRMDPDVIFTYAKVSYDQDSKELTNGKHIQMFMEDLQSRDPIIQLPEKYMMVGRTSIILRGLAHALKQSRSVAKLWRPIAERVLKEDI